MSTIRILHCAQKGKIISHNRVLLSNRKDSNFTFLSEACDKIIHNRMRMANEDLNVSAHKKIIQRATSNYDIMITGKEACLQ